MLQLGYDLLEPLGNAALIAIEDMKCRLEIAASERVIHFKAIRFELLDIRLKEIASAGIKVAEVGVENL